MKIIVKTGLLLFFLPLMAAESRLKNKIRQRDIDFSEFDARVLNNKGSDGKTALDLAIELALNKNFESQNLPDWDPLDYNLTIAGLVKAGAQKLDRSHFSDPRVAKLFRPWLAGFLPDENYLTREEQILLPVLWKDKDPNVPGSDGVLPLHKALDKGFDTAMENLVEVGADIKLVPRDCYFLASENLYTALILNLYKVTQAWVTMQKEELSPEEFNKFINIDLKGTQVQSPTTGSFLYGVNYLGRAVIKKETRIAEFLLKNGASVDIADKEGMKPLERAIESKNVEMVKLLLKYGAHKIQSKNTLLYQAFLIQNEQTKKAIVELLLDHGVSLYDRNKDGFFALQELLVDLDKCRYRAEARMIQPLINYALDFHYKEDTYILVSADSAHRAYAVPETDPRTGKVLEHRLSALTIARKFSMGGDRERDKIIERLENLPCTKDSSYPFPEGGAGTSSTPSQEAKQDTNVSETAEPKGVVEASSPADTKSLLEAYLQQIKDQPNQQQRLELSDDQLMAALKKSN